MSKKKLSEILEEYKDDLEPLNDPTIVSQEPIDQEEQEEEVENEL